MSEKAKKTFRCCCFVGRRLLKGVCFFLCLCVLCILFHRAGHRPVYPFLFISAVQEHIVVVVFVGVKDWFYSGNVHGQLHAGTDVGGLDRRARAGEERGEALLLLLRGEGAVVWGVCGGGGGSSGG